MSLTERGIYITLLSHCWLDVGLPIDPGALARLAGMKRPQFDRVWQGPLSECFYEKAGKFQNARLDTERKNQAEFRRKQRERAEQRWHPKDIGNAAALPEPHASGNALQSPISDLRSSVKRERPLVRTRRAYAAWEGPKGLYVPQGKHMDFAALRNHPTAESELLRWYDEVAAAWEGSPGADMLKFWTDRYNEKWPPPETPKRDPRRPSWAV